MSQQIVMDKLPTCDICGTKPARYDCVTNLGGRWGNLCVEDWPRYRATSKLGTGYGQRFVLEGEGERIPDGAPLPPAPWERAA